MLSTIVRSMLEGPLTGDGSVKVTKEQKDILSRDDLAIREGKIVCRVCGSYCGQCPVVSVVGMDAKKFLTMVCK